MATIDLSSRTFYMSGKSGVSQVVGNDWADNAVAHRVVRYTITAPPEGASHVSLSFQAGAHGNGAYNNLRYFIGTSDSSHVDAGPDSEYTGQFEVDLTYLIFTAETDIILLPNETYYLWLFPAEDAFGWYYWNYHDNSSMETDGSAACINIDKGATVEPYALCVEDGTDWYLLGLYIEDGTDWYVLGSDNSGQ